MHSNLYTLGVITDIAQAFDTVDHTIFLKKPELHGLEDNAQNLIKILFTKQETMSCNRPQIEKQFQIVVFPKDQYWDPFYCFCMNIISKMFLSFQDLIMFADNEKLLHTHINIHSLFFDVNKNLAIIKKSRNVKKPKYSFFSKSLVRRTIFLFGYQI